MFGKKRIYLDYASTTPIDLVVEKAMRPLWSGDFGNAGSVHAEGVKAKKVLDEARARCARTIGCKSDEIVFTSGGTESNNLALQGSDTTHIFTTKIEHSSILKTVSALEKKGSTVTYIPLREDGLIDLEQFEKLLEKKPTFISIGYVNGEIGVVQPIARIAKLIEKHSPHTVFHVDASQAPNYHTIQANTLDADLITFDAQKIYGPKGIGMLYVARGTKLSPLLFGGGQEKGLRSGTEPLPLIVGLSVALEQAGKNQKKEAERLKEIQRYAFELIKEKLPHAVVNGSIEHRTPNNINISLPGVDTEFLVIKLDQKGFAVSTKSTCVESEAGSYVVEALTGDRERAQNTLRISMGKDTTKKDITVLIHTISQLV